MLLNVKIVRFTRFYEHFIDLHVFHRKITIKT
jgi:hypothetical protein